MNNDSGTEIADATAIRKSELLTRSSRRSHTGLPLAYDVPKSPVSNPFNHSK